LPALNAPLPDRAGNRTVAIRSGRPMSISLGVPARADATSAAGATKRLPRAPWNPYLAGMLLGGVLLLTYLITGRGLGATAGFAALATGLAGLLGAEVTANAVHARYWNGGAPLANWTLVLLAGAALGAFVSGRLGGRVGLAIERGPRTTDRTRLLLAFAGGFVVAYGAKIAKGCTSGQALTGGAMLNAGSLVFMLAVFASAYALAYVVRKEWL
jgi:uncharacterized membrane protein YedE/YeeE